jgi:acyl-CoA reductase-like NAD-dependent aldehyde dehydrogenase
MTNGGQSCSALERFFIHSSLHDKFVETLVSCLKDMKTGSHLDKQTQVGPIKSSKVRQRILDQINSAINQGAELVIGGEEFGVNNPDSLGILPTVLTNCNPTMAVVKDETFGPVFPIIKFNNEEDLLSKVGQCEYGLNASAFGTCSPAVHDYLKKNHRNFYIDSTSVDASNSYTRFLDGGHLRSGLIWKRVNGDVVTIRGARLLYKELSQEI